jgi:RNA polymerase sigma-70 factor (ECF subfamily)
MEERNVTTDLPLVGVDGPLSVGQVDVVPPTFERIFRDEAAYVGRTLRYLGVRDPHLEDACQEVFVVVHRQLGQVRGYSARAWVRQICVLVANNHRRSLRRRREDAVAEPPEVVAPAPQQGEVERSQALRRLHDALDALGDDQRSVFVLYEIEQLTMAEIAEAVGCPLQTAYSRLYAARAKVQAAMKDMAP